MEYSFLQNGDMALTVQFKKEISEEVNRLVTSLCAVLEKNKIDGITDFIPTFTSLTVCYDCTVISSSKLKKKLSSVLKSLNSNVKDKVKRVFEVPVCYGGEYGEDIAFVSKHTGLTEREIIDIHSSRDYLVYMLGFLPGFPYLGGLDERLFTPRLESPRTVIPQGSVGIGAEQTGIYPSASPGGWQLIGTTPIKLYDPTRENPVLFSSGDYIRFKPISKSEYEEISRKIKSGSYTIQEITEEPT